MSVYYYSDHYGERLRIIRNDKIEININNKNPIIIPIEEWEKMHEIVKEGELLYR
jgi:hypothetical protein